MKNFEGLETYLNMQGQGLRQAFVSDKNNVSLPPYVINELHPFLPNSQTIDWGTAILNIPDIHKSGITGKGVVVAVIDTGIDKTHPGLVGVVSEVFNTTAEAFSATNGHGIGCAGIIGAKDNDEGILGVAPDCTIIGIKGMRETGGGDLSEIIKAIDLAIQKKVHIINLSLGTTGDVTAFRSVIARATSAGIYVICSAGNAGQEDSIVYPAKYPNTVAVGATNMSGRISAFSSRGSEIDISAPGEKILTTWKNKSYAKVSGTSFSAPYVSGCFALFIEAQIKMDHEKLQKTAVDIEEPGWDKKSGHGLINPSKLIQTYKGSTPRPTEVPVDLSKVEQAYNLLSDFLKK